ncbi:DUF1630-domain-containing protein [Auricularia subglabra TFB-10046 SS5]|uniref:DUF1630-domain-containing protein n=1 Tax=Auricularia subglabra (strain TFB-10046 / SS5) TaxID=717982 RepID=J0D133_AURST|nr:DUF1630-domain-containing protein [Auricularia subglabra TFB-10046 SS5]
MDMDGPTELDIGVDGGIQHSLDPGRLVAMRRWILCIAIVNFDIDTGPVVDQLYPSATLDASLKENIAFSSFPDASAVESTSELHSFRIRHTTGTALDHTPLQDGFIYGFAYFLQRRDPSLKRGFLQRSVVILTHLPYPSLFTLTVSRLAPLYFEHGTTMLETACHNIANWPAPTPGATIEVGFIGGVHTVAIPRRPDDPQFIETSAFGDKFDAKQHIIASIPPLVALPSASQSPTTPTFSMTISQSPSLLSLCRDFIPSLWSIWECLILCEPILVFAPHPALTSVLIWWFRDMTRPLPLAYDFRPYFTIHDRDFPDFVPRAKPQSRTPNALPPPKAGLLLGVTNPFFESACSHWPHIISLRSRSQPIPAVRATQTLSRSASAKGRDRGNVRTMTAGGASPSKSRSMFDFSLTSVSHARTPPTSHASQQPTHVGPEPGWHTKTHARYVSKDRTLIAQMQSAVAKGGSTEIEACWALRQHFASRTTAMLAPLNRYMNSLIPPGGQGGRLRPFNNEQFFVSLETHGAALPFRSSAKRRAFYERWLRTPAFGTWLAQAEERISGSGVLQKHKQ